VTGNRQTVWHPTPVGMTL